MKKLFLILILIIFIAGCETFDPVKIAKQNEQVNNFISTYPNSEITATFLTKEQVQENLGEIKEFCQKDIQITSLYKIIIIDYDSTATFKAYLNPISKQMECSKRIEAEVKQEEIVAAENEFILYQGESIKTLNHTIKLYSVGYYGSISIEVDDIFRQTLQEFQSKKIKDLRIENAKPVWSNNEDERYAILRIDKV